MPDLAQIIEETIEGVIGAMDRSANGRLRAHVAELIKLAGKEPGVSELDVLMGKGWTPDYFVGGEISLSASLSVATERKRTVEAGGSVRLGPVAVTGGFTNTFGQSTATNLTVSIQMVRQSRTAGLEYALATLTAVPLPVPGGG